MHGLLEEAAGDDTQVALRRFVDHHRVVEQVVRHQKTTHRVLLGNLARKLRGEAQRFSLVEEKLRQVLLWLLRDERDDTSHRVVPRAVACVGRRRRAGQFFFRQPHVDLRRKRDEPRLLLEVLSGKAIGVVDVKRSVVHLDTLPNLEVRDVDVLVLLVRGVHRSAQLGLSLGHAHALAEERETVAAAVERVLLADLNGVVRQKVHDHERPTLVLRCDQVVHNRVEPAHHAVLVHKLLHVRVDVSAVHHSFVVDLFVGSLGLRRHDVLLGQGLCERVLFCLGLCQCHILWLPEARVVLLRELVAVVYSDFAPEEVEVFADLEVIRRDEARPVRFPQLAPLQEIGGEAFVSLSADGGEDTTSAVARFRHGDLDGVILQVVEELELLYPVVLQIRLTD
mmetsp:Transcript_17936/g.44776  ORF Transcript_17936/g.44776 Transcript_17936/m.44776 type:complete len:395 (+) Transcript_17936:1537-2721(+)